MMPRKLVLRSKTNNAQKKSEVNRANIKWRIVKANDSKKDTSSKTSTNGKSGHDERLPAFKKISPQVHDTLIHLSYKEEENGTVDGANCQKDNGSNNSADLCAAPEIQSEKKEYNKIYVQRESKRWSAWTVWRKNGGTLKYLHLNTS